MLRSFAAPDTWVNPGSGNWLSGANWSTGVVPDATTRAVIDNGGTAVMASGGAIANASEIDIGNNATGSLLLNSGVISDASVNIANNAGASNGTATVNGGTWSTSGDFTVAPLGTGILTINGGQVSDRNAYIGTLGTATVNGGTWQTSGTLVVGYGAGVGTLNINGGYVSDNTGIIAEGGLSSSAGAAAPSQAVVNVSGGTWYNASDLYVGYLSTGAMNLSGGYVSDNNGIVGRFGASTVNVSGGTWNNAGGLYAGGDFPSLGAGVINIIGSGVVAVGGGAGTVTLGYGAGGQGILNIGNGGIFTGALQAAMVTSGSGSGVINFNAGNNITFAPAMTGNLSVNQTGSGTTVLTGANSYTGGTTITSGALQIGNGTTAGSITGNVVDNGMLIYSHSDNISPSGNITGSGGVVQAGTGTLTFNGSQIYSYTGATQILAGTLFLDPVALSTSQVIVYQGATLSGAGSIAGNLINAGIVAPQSQISVGGNFNNMSGGVVLITISSASTFSTLRIGGSATLGGTLQVLVAPGYKPKAGNTFQVLTAAGGVTGQFATVTQPGYFGVLYDPDNVLLFIHNGAGGTPSPPDQTPALSTGASRVLSGLMGNTLLQWKQLTLSNAEVLFNTMDNRVAALREGQRGFANYGLGAAPLPQAQDPSKTDVKSSAPFTTSQSNPWSGWSAGNGTFARVTNLDNLPSFRSESGSAFTGADYRLFDQLAVGVFGGYQYNFAKFNGGSQLYSNGARFGLYTAWSHAGFWASGLASGGFDNYELFRSTGAGTVRSTPQGGVFQTQAATGYDWKLGGLTLGLNTALQYTRLTVGAYSEDQTGELAAEVGTQVVNSLRTNLGATASFAWKFAPDWTLVPSLGATWQYELLDGSTTIPVQLQGLPGYSYNVAVAAGDRNILIGSAGLGLAWKDLASLSFGYLLQQSANITSQTLQAQISVSF